MVDDSIEMGASGLIVRMVLRIPHGFFTLLVLAAMQNACITTRSDMLREISADMDRIQVELNDRHSDRQQMAEERKRVLDEINARLSDDGSSYETVAPAPPQQPAVIDAPIPTTSDSNAATMTNSQADIAFRRAQSFYNRGEYSDAAEEFVLGYRYASDPNMKARALYWLGESYYRLRHWERAISCFAKFESEFPEQKLASAAMLKKGYSLLQDGQAVSGKATLRILIETYPQSAEAPLAQERLDSLE